MRVEQLGNGNSSEERSEDKILSTHLFCNGCQDPGQGWSVLPSPALVAKQQSEPVVGEKNPVMPAAASCHFQ